MAQNQHLGIHSFYIFWSHSPHSQPYPHLYLFLNKILQKWRGIIFSHSRKFEDISDL